MSLKTAFRRPKGPAAGTLVLFHGRGADESDLLPLADMLDPDGELLVAAPRAPLPLGFGAQWYELGEVGQPDGVSFRAGREAAAEWLAELLTAEKLESRPVFLGGFSQGAVMSYALGLGVDQPRPAGILAFSGYLPTAHGFSVDAGRAQGLPVMIQHGVEDPIIAVEWGRQAGQWLREAGATVSYLEYPMSHTISPEGILAAAEWLARRRGRQGDSPVTPVRAD